MLTSGLLLLVLIQGNAHNYDKISYVTVTSQIALDTVKAARNHTLRKEAIRISVTVFVTEVVKHSVRRIRPDKSDDMSFYSEHTALTAQAQGWNLYIGIPITGMTGYSRVKAKKHYWTDVIVGGLVGSAVERIIH